MQWSLIALSRSCPKRCARRGPVQAGQMEVNGIAESIAVAEVAGTLLASWAADCGGAAILVLLQDHGT